MYSLKIVDIPADKMKTEKLMDIIEKLRVNDEFCDAPAFILRMNNEFKTSTTLRQLKLGDLGGIKTRTKTVFAEVADGLYQNEDVIQDYDEFNVNSFIQRILHNPVVNNREVESDFMKYMDRDERKKIHHQIYAENIEGSLLEIAMINKRNVPAGFNLNQLSGPLRTMYGRNTNAGITSSFVYFGDKKSVSTLHTEDVDLMSINYLFPDSSPKVWLTVKSDDEKLLLQKIREKLPGLCVNPLLHKAYHVDLQFFMDNNIDVHVGYQLPGDFIITNPGVFHQVINLGPNCAEAVNAYCRRQPVIARRRNCCACPDRLKYHQGALMQPLYQLIMLNEFSFIHGLRTRTNKESNPKPRTEADRNLNFAIPVSQPVETVVPVIPVAQPVETVEPTIPVLTSDPHEINEIVIDSQENSPVKKKRKKVSSDLETVHSKEPQKKSKNTEGINGIIDKLVDNTIENAISGINQVAAAEEPGTSTTAEDESNRIASDVNELLVDDPVLTNTIRNFNEVVHGFEANDDYTSLFGSLVTEDQRIAKLSNIVNKIQRNDLYNESIKAAHQRELERLKNLPPVAKRRNRNRDPITRWFEAKKQTTQRSIATQVRKGLQQNMKYVRLTENLKKLEDERAIYQGLKEFIPRDQLNLKQAEGYRWKEVVRDYVDNMDPVERALLIASIELKAINPETKGTILNSIKTIDGWNDFFGVDDYYRLPFKDYY